MSGRRAGQGWPESHGQLKVITTANPAAGAEVSHTVPTGVRWQVLGVGVQLVTAVAVANRIPRLVINDGGTDVLNYPAGTVQAASLTVDYSFVPSVGGYGVTGFTVVPISDPLIVKAGYVIKTITSAIQAADDYGVAKILVMEWADA